MRQFFFYPRRVTTLFVSSLLFVILISIPGCKGGNPVSPIVIPNGEYDWSKTASPGDSSGITHRGTGSYSGGNLNMTGPEEYITSGLSPKLITTATPIFSASVSDVDADLTSDDFSATIDGDQITCSWNQSTGEVTFQPTGDLSDGPHRAQLFLKIPNGPMRMLHWNFMIRTRTPEIDFVMWNSESKWALVVFKDDIEPSAMLDNSRWNFNNQYNILRANVGSAGKNMALLPLSNTAFGLFTNPLGPLSLGFHDKTGPVMHVIRRGGGMEREVQAACENCSGISYYWYEPDHRYLEAGDEKYATAFSFSNPIGCDLEMVWEGWHRTPVAHTDPSIDFEQEQDELCSGQTETGEPGNPYPEYFSMIIPGSPVIDTRTVFFDRLYMHDLTVSVWADCGPGKREGSNSEYETRIERKDFVFGDVNSLTQQGFDCKNPIFDHEPVVLYGDEAADLIENDWMAGIPFDTEPVDGDKYCFSIKRGPDPSVTTFDNLLDDLRSNSCKLFIVAQASDPIGNDRDGSMDIHHMVLDMKHEPAGDPVWYDYGSVSGGMVTAIAIDNYPWGGAYLGTTLDDYEFLDEWPDPNYGEYGLYEGQPPRKLIRHDWAPGESAIMYWPLTDLLVDTPGNEDVTDIRVRIIDDNPDPAGGGIDGNWRRSGNVLEQLCSIERSGAVERHSQVLGNEIHIEVEPGLPPDTPGHPQIYWIDGPNIPITGTDEHPVYEPDHEDEHTDPIFEEPIPEYCWDDWDLYTLQHAQLKLNSPNPLCPIGSYVPDWDSLRVGKLKLRVCITCPCDIAAFRIYAKGPNETHYDIKPDPEEENLYFTNVQDYQGSCANPLPDRCLDDGYIIWDISSLPCGEYQIHVEAYDAVSYMFIHRGYCTSITRYTDMSEWLELTKVCKADLVRIAPIYNGDRYLNNPKQGYSVNGLRPRNNHYDKDANDKSKTVDCTNYVTQLLRRLARFDFNSQIEPDNSPITGTYPIDHSAASWWNTDRTEEVTHLEDHQWYLMEKGDLVTRDPSKPGKPHHVMVFVVLDSHIPDQFVGPIAPDYYGYEYDIWESTSEKGGKVLLNTRQGDKRTHFRQWIDHVVFTECN